MLLIVLFNIIFVGFFVAANLAKEDTTLKSVLKTIAGVAAIIFFILCFSAIKVNLEQDTLEAEWSERYDAIYSQAYYKMYDDDYAKKELADQIMAWNIEYETYWTKKDNIWISCFYPIRIINYKPISIELLGISKGGLG